MEPKWNRKENAMAATITVKNIPTRLYARLKHNAAQHHRSINSEIIALIEAALVPRKITPKDFLASARTLREKTGRYKLTQNFVDKAKREGRV
jgi:plasmid stability protein